MAKRKVKYTEKEEASPSTEVVDSLPLVNIGSPIRFRHRPEQGWTKGVVKGEYKDGSLDITDSYGRARNCMPENVEVEVKGPRGGKKWYAANAKP